MLCVFICCWMVTMILDEFNTGVKLVLLVFLNHFITCGMVR